MKLIRTLATAAAALLLAACAAEPMATLPLDGGQACRVYGSMQGARRLEIVAADGSVVQTIVPPAPDIEPTELGGVTVVDLDFDGDLDLRLATYRYKTGDTRYTCYLADGGSFVWHEGLSALRELAVDAEAGCLVAWERGLLADEYELTTRVRYAFVDGVLTELARRSLYHYIAEGEEMYRVVDTVEGNEVEDWVFPEQYDEAEIWK